MLSRVADSLYWMSRYLERAEHTARLLDVNLNLMLDESADVSDHRWLRMLNALGKPRRVKWEGSPYALTNTMTFDTGNKASVISCILKARENARHVREQISTEQWHRLNSLYLEVTRPEFRATDDRRRPALQRGRTRGIPTDCDGSRPPVSGRDRLHHVARRRLALHPGWPLP